MALPMHELCTQLSPSLRNDRQSRLQVSVVLCSKQKICFRKEDIIDPDSSKAVLESEAWKELQQLIGLQYVKDSVEAFINRIATNYTRELQEVAPVEVSMTRVFLGFPVTGQTPVAKLYCQILVDISAPIIVKNPSDFVGSAIGESERNTTGILETSRRKVLIIDEAYMLNFEAGTWG
ncbi:hypothetical protein BDZ91DRAFT_802782 [Kalaharituber pfeilii]|nr:hypothetical protein BDZ91DRAFT_802782 [Kalaharituber pfeilii]